MFLAILNPTPSSKIIFFDLPNIEQFRNNENNPHHWLTTDILQIHHFQYQLFQNLAFNASTKEQIQIYSLFLRNFFRHNYKLIWHSKFQSACVNVQQQFTNDEFLPFFDTSDNHHPQVHNLLDFPSPHFSYITYDSNSIDKRLNLPTPVRPYAKQNPLPPSIDTTSNISLQTLPSSSNVIVIANPSTNQNFYPSTSQTTTITNNLFASHTHNQDTTPSNTPPVLLSNIAQLPVYQIPAISSILLSLNNTTTTTQPQNPPTNFSQNPSLINQNPPSSVPISQNLFNSQHSTSSPLSTSYNPHVSLHPGFQNYPTISFQPHNFPPIPLPPSTSALPFNLPSSYLPPLLQMTPSVPFATLSDPI